MTEGVMGPAVSVQQYNWNSYYFFASALLTFFFSSITISDDLRDVFFIIHFFFLLNYILEAFEYGRQDTFKLKQLNTNHFCKVLFTCI